MDGFETRERQSELHSVLTRLLDRHRLPGAAVAYFKNGEKVSAVHGNIERATEVPYSMHSIVRVSCIVKTLHAIQIMVLKEENALDLSEPIPRYLAEIEPFSNGFWNQVTCAHLLNHTAGLVGSLNLRGEPATTGSVLREVQKLSQGDLFIGAPGKYCSYSNLGYVLLACIVERLRGRSWTSDLQDRIFAPIGVICRQLENTGASRLFAPKGEVIENGQVVNLDERNLFKRMLIEDRMVSPAMGGALALSAHDLLSIGVALLAEGGAPDGPRILSAASVSEMSQNVSALSGPWPGVYGFSNGWIKFDDGSVGQTGGGLSNVLLRVLPEESTVLAVVTNYRSAAPLFEDLWRHLCPGRKAIEIPGASEAKRPFGHFAGIYGNGTQRLIVSNEGSALSVEQTYGGVSFGKTAMTRLGGNHFTARHEKQNGYWFPPSETDRASYLWDTTALFKRIE